MLPWERDGKLPAGSEAPFRRNIETIGISAEGLGAEVLLLTMPSSPRHRPDPGELWLPGLAEHNQILRDLAAAHGWLLADAEPWPDEDPEAAAMFLDIVHLSKEGNQAKARIVADALLAGWEPLSEIASDH
jgi:lysophospholipase L1-like esterase